MSVTVTQGIFSADSHYVCHCSPSLCYDSDQAVQASFLTTFPCITSPEFCLRLTLILGLFQPQEKQGQKVNMQTLEQVPTES